jgi:hypothetical protein
MLTKATTEAITAGLAALALSAGIGACGSTASSTASNTASPTAGCSKINSTLDAVFNGNYAGLPAVKTSRDLVSNFLGQTNNAPSAMVDVMAAKVTAPKLRTVEVALNTDVNTLVNSSGGYTQSQADTLVPMLRTIRGICGASATWTQNTVITSQAADPGGLTPAQQQAAANAEYKQNLKDAQTQAAQEAADAKTAAAQKAKADAAALSTSISSQQWGIVTRDPGPHAGEAYTISGTVAQYDINSNTFATVGNAALIAVGPDGTRFVMEGDSALLNKLSVGSVFTARVTVIGAVTMNSVVGGGTGQIPAFDAKIIGNITG